MSDGFDSRWHGGVGAGGFHDGQAEIFVEDKRLRFHIDGGTAAVRRATRALVRRLKAWNSNHEDIVERVIFGKDDADEAWWDEWYRQRLGQDLPSFDAPSPAQAPDFPVAIPTVEVSLSDLIRMWWRHKRRRLR